MIQSSHSALVTNTSNGSPDLKKETIPVPELGPHQALVRVSYVAQNPTDVQAFDNNAFGDGTVLGCDFAGTVEAIGTSVTKISQGDVIAGLIWGGEHKGLGAFSEFTIADESICFKVPSGVSLEEASTVPLAAATSWLALFSPDCLHINRNEKPVESVLVWGGSSSVGLYAIQIASLSGLDVVTTCSPRNFDLVRSYGAKHVVDYHDEDVATKVRSIAPRVRYVFDTIGNSTSSVIASQAIQESGGTLCTVRPGKAFTEEVTKRTKVTDVLVWTAFLHDHQYKEFKWPASTVDHELADEFFQKVPEWLTNGQIKASKPKVLNGLAAVKEGFQEHRDKKISGYKIVYKI